MKFVNQLGPLYVCHRAGDFSQDMFANHGSSKVMGWVYAADGAVGMICEAPYGMQLIPFSGDDICCMARHEEGLMHHESGVR